MSPFNPFSLRGFFFLTFQVLYTHEGNCSSFKLSLVAKEPVCKALAFITSDLELSGQTLVLVGNMEIRMGIWHSLYFKELLECK